MQAVIHAAMLFSVSLAEDCSMTAPRNYLIYLCASLNLALGCGEQKSSPPGDGANSAVELAFNEAARSSAVPKRLLMAVGYLESRLDPNAASTKQGGLRLSPSYGESAFGLGRKELGIAKHPDQDLLATQIKAYGEWLAQKAEGLELSREPKSAQEIFAWVWEIAKFHRHHSIGERNLRTLFAKELLDVLNTGFVWQDPKSKAVLRLKAAPEELRAEDLSPENQVLLRLVKTRSSEVPAALFFPLLPSSPDSKTNVPKGIEVIHCPFSLSACLAMQTKEGKRTGLFEAHYAIPPASKGDTEILQLARHATKLRYRDKNGILKENDNIVIMLAGHSGRIVDGKRISANPQWLSQRQLLDLAELVATSFGICDVLRIRHGEQFGLSGSDCKSYGKGVRARLLASQGPISWGDIPDLDPKILAAYLQSPGGLSGATAISFTEDDRVYKAGTVDFQLAFQISARTIDLEKLVRCDDGRLVWAALATAKEVRGKTKLEYSEEFYTSGPNGTGDHFLRTRSYDKSGQLIGWDLQNFMITDFESPPAQTNRECLIYQELP